jgi:hypothetical protein
MYMYMYIGMKDVIVMWSGRCIVDATRDKRPTSDICFSKVGFLAFITMNVNHTAEIECKSQNIDVVVAAAEKCLGVWDLTSEELQGVLIGGWHAIGMVWLAGLGWLAGYRGR